MSVIELARTQNLHVTVAGGAQLSVRDFVVEEGLSSLFEVNLVVMSSSVDVDFEAAIGAPARFEIRKAELGGVPRAWGGICAELGLRRVEEDGLTTYAMRIVPELWLLGQRRNYRVFQDQSELDAALAVLGGWGIAPQLDLDPGSYPKRRFRVQYAETDLAFVSRMLEDIGVTYHFGAGEGASRLVLVDAPNHRDPSVSLPFVSTPHERLDKAYVTGVRTGRFVRPGRYTQSDVDYRKALDYPLAASDTRGTGIERQLESYHHVYGGFLWKAQAGGDTPVADDRGPARTDEGAGKQQVQRRLEAQRVEARSASFTTSVHDLQPGVVMTIVDHPRAELAAPLLVESTRLSGSPIGEWEHRCQVRFTDVDYRPAMATPKPRTLGLESATVTGPAGEEIHTDEFGRIRVHFHWDREGVADQSSSCWIPVSQPWAGAGFGAINLPRVGQEVIVDFLGSDPDRPIILGRVFTKTTPPPYELPKFKMVSGLRSESYPRPKPASGGARMGGGPTPEAAIPTQGVPLASGAFAAGETVVFDATSGAARPVVGGLGLEALGGGGEAGTGVAPAGPAGTPQPGIFGGVPAAPEELNESIQRMRSLGPDGADHNRSANGLVFEDSAGAERTYLQGQRDLFLAVKNNLTGSVGNNRAYSVTGNDFEAINGYQATSVQQDRTVYVKGKQNHQVEQDILVDGLKNRVVVTKQHLYSETVDGGQIHQSKLGILLRVGDHSAIMLTPESILIDAPKVYINPGPDVMQAIYGGQTPEEAIAARDSEARINAITQTFLQNETNALGRRFDTAGQQQMRQSQLQRAAAGPTNNPMTHLARNNVPGATPAEIQEGAARAASIMY